MPSGDLHAIHGLIHVNFINQWRKDIQCSAMSIKCCRIEKKIRQIQLIQKRHAYHVQCNLSIICNLKIFYLQCNIMCIKDINPLDKVHILCEGHKKVEIRNIFVAFSEYMNFMFGLYWINRYAAEKGHLDIIKRYVRMNWNELILKKKVWKCTKH